MVQTYCVACHSQNDAEAGIGDRQAQSRPGVCGCRLVGKGVAAASSAHHAARGRAAAGSERRMTPSFHHSRRLWIGATREEPQPGDTEIASRLAALLWNSAPDQPASRRGQVGPLERPGRARTASPANACPMPGRKPWSQVSSIRGYELDRLAAVKPDPQVFPGFRRTFTGSFPARDRPVTRKPVARRS